MAKKWKLIVDGGGEDRDGRAICDDPVAVVNLLRPNLPIGNGGPTQDGHTSRCCTG